MMKQSEVFKEIRDRTGIPVTKISTVIGTLTDIVHELAENDKLTIERLATFTRFRPTVTEYRVNGKVGVIPPRTKVKIRPSKLLTVRDN